MPPPKKMLPRYSDIYGSTYVSPEDFPGGKTVKVKITDLEALELTCNKGGRLMKNIKIVLTCAGCKKKIAVNKTSAKRLAMDWTQDFTKWIGHEITVTAGLVNNKPAVLLAPVKSTLPSPVSVAGVAAAEEVPELDEPGANEPEADNLEGMEDLSPPPDAARMFK